MSIEWLPWHPDDGIGWQTLVQELREVVTAQASRIDALEKRVAKQRLIPTDALVRAELENLLGEGFGSAEHIIPSRPGWTYVSVEKDGHDFTGQPRRTPGAAWMSVLAVVRERVLRTVSV